MPIYEYDCEACGKEFEREQRITDKPLRSCPHCRSRRVKRLISRTSFVLKGGGWYSELYASPKSEKTEKTPADKSGQEKASTGETSLPSETKPSSETKAPTEKTPKKSPPKNPKATPSGSKTAA